MIVFCLLFSPILASLEINYQLIFRFTFITITYLSLFLSIITGITGRGMERLESSKQGIEDRTPKCGEVSRGKGRGGGKLMSKQRKPQMYRQMFR